MTCHGADFAVLYGRRCRVDQPPRDPNRGKRATFGPYCSHSPLDVIRYYGRATATMACLGQAPTIMFGAADAFAGAWGSQQSSLELSQCTIGPHHQNHATTIHRHAYAER